MLRPLQCALAAILLFATTAAHADWKYYPRAKILHFMQWQDSQPVYFEVDPGTWCYVLAEEKNMIALLLTLYSSGKTASIHCHETVESVGGMAGHRLHRIIANQD